MTGDSMQELLRVAIVSSVSRSDADVAFAAWKSRLLQLCLVGCGVCAGAVSSNTLTNTA